MSSFRTPALLSVLLLAAVTARAQPAPAPATPESTPAAEPESPPAPAAPATPPPANSRAANGGSNLIGPIKFGAIDIDAAIERLEAWSGRTALRPKELPAVSIAFSINQRMTKAEAQQALVSVLTLNGIAVTPLGDKFLKVTPLATARSEAPDFIEGSTLKLTPSGHLAQKIFQLQFLRIGEFMPQIAGLLNGGAAAPPLLFEKANAALVTDTVSNLQRIETLIARLDQPSLGGLAPKFYKVQNTTASELVTKLQSLLNGASATQLGTGTIFQADDRTNQIIVLSDPRQHAFFDDLIAKLDVAGESSTRQEVIPLKHAVATDVATVLTSLITGQVAAARTANQTNQNQANARNTANALTALANRNTTTPAGTNGAAGNNNNPAQAAQAAAQARAGQVTFGPGGLRDQGLEQRRRGRRQAPRSNSSTILTVVPDDRSNSLVVSGTVDDMRLIKDLVSHLDVLLAQVRIEVVIAEITLDDAATSGLDSLGLDRGVEQARGLHRHRRQRQRHRHALQRHHRRARPRRHAQPRHHAAQDEHHHPLRPQHRHHTQQGEPLSSSAKRSRPSPATRTPAPPPALASAPGLLPATSPSRRSASASR